MAPTTPITTVKPFLCGGDGGDTGAVAAVTLTAKRQKKVVKNKEFKVSNNLLPPPKQVLRSQLGGDVAAGDSAKTAILSQEEDTLEDVVDGEEPRNKEESNGDDPDARADEARYDTDADAKGGRSRLRFGMAELEAAMSMPGSMASWFAKRVGLTTMTKMATTYKAVVRLIVNDRARALVAALAPKVNDRTYLAVPNEEGVFLVFHGLTWWADAPGGARNQQGHLAAFEGNVRSRCGVSNLWRFDKPDKQLFWLVKLPPVALCNVPMFYSSDNNKDYYWDTIVPDKGGAGWALMCGCLIPVPGEWAALFLDYPDLSTTIWQDR
jgi:hypothetical protein